MREIFFTLSEPTILLNKLIRMHWTQRKRHGKELAWKVRDAVKPPKTPLARCEVYIRRYSTSLPDWDGLYGGCKPLLDCFVVPTKRNPHGLGFIEDDNPACIIKLDVIPIRTKHRADQRTEITIREVE